MSCRLQNQPDPIVISRVAPREASLEDVFFKVTGEVYEEADSSADVALSEEAAE